MPSRLLVLLICLFTSSASHANSPQKEKVQKNKSLATKAKKKPVKSTPKPPPIQEGNVLIRKDGSGTGRVWSQPRGLECFEKCTEFEIGWNQPRATIFASAASDSQFTGWAGACVGLDDMCELNDANTGVRVVIAQFEKKQMKATAKLNEEPIACRKKSLDPVLRCGRVGDDKKYTQQIDCWLQNCMGELDLFQQDAISVFDSKGNKIEGSVKLATPTLIAFIANQPFADGETYTLKFKKTALKSSTQKALKYENLIVNAGDLEFIFKGNDHASH